MPQDTISEIYKSQLIFAKKLSDENKVRYNSTFNLNDEISDLSLEKTNNLLQRFSKHLSLGIPGYWGDRCIDISANVYVFLRRLNIPCEIIYGDIKIKDKKNMELELNL